MKIIILTIFLIISLISAQSERVQFGVTFPNNNDLPKTAQIAQNQGWKKLTDDCVKGQRYISSKSDISNILMYDKQGRLVGVEVGVPKIPSEPMKSRYYEKVATPYEHYALTGYFVDPSTICGQRTAPEYGDRVWWKQNDGNYFKLPLTIEEAHRDTKWKLGTCILGMGLHYWYDISNGMSCNDFTPFFVMYNNKKLTTFAVGFGIDELINSPDSRFEHAPKIVVRANFRAET
jgi:hypothetical protein